ncbi:hypothetical protein Tco_0955480 [Tanacetum coccineum]|uniref:Uncharacterized protein n=1 Tax=Tanacetum coccineum TaxID=301880 RepID=A0ABQ5E7B5_9ASTR
MKMALKALVFQLHEHLQWLINAPRASQQASAYPRISWCGLGNPSKFDFPSINKLWTSPSSESSSESRKEKQVVYLLIRHWAQDLGFENANFESQAPPSFDVYTLPVTYSEEVDETRGISMEVESLDHTKLEDLGLNTSSHDLFLSYREIPSVNELEP